MVFFLVLNENKAYWHVVHLVKDIRDIKSIQEPLISYDSACTVRISKTVIVICDKLVLIHEQYPTLSSCVFQLIREVSFHTAHGHSILKTAWQLLERAAEHWASNLPWQVPIGILHARICAELHQQHANFPPALARCL